MFKLIGKLIFYNHAWIIDNMLHELCEMRAIQ